MSIAVVITEGGKTRVERFNPAKLSCTFGKSKEKGGPVVSYFNYEGATRFHFQTRKLVSPFGLKYNDQVDDKGNLKYKPVYTISLNIDDPELAAVLNAIDDCYKAVLFANADVIVSADQRKKNKSMGISDVAYLGMTYNRLVRESEKYGDSLRVKVSHTGDYTRPTFKARFFDNEGAPIMRPEVKCKGRDIEMTVAFDIYGYTAASFGVTAALRDARVHGTGEVRAGLVDNLEDALDGAAPAMFEPAAASASAEDDIAPESAPAETDEAEPAEEVAEPAEPAETDIAYEGTDDEGEAPAPAPAPAPSRARSSRR